jgi:hypothetical protein
MIDQPLKVYRLDDKAQRRTDCVDILVHDFLDYRRLACIVESAVSCQYKLGALTKTGLQHENSHLFVLETCLSQYGEHLLVPQDSISWRFNTTEILCSTMRSNHLRAGTALHALVSLNEILLPRKGDTTIGRLFISELAVSMIRNSFGSVT